MHAEGPHPPTSLDSIRCSFCGKRGTEVEAIVAGPTPAVAICKECVGLCAEIVSEQHDPPPGAGPAAA
jgi:ATP-dependent Clp protease ATP-binding subunit ClpX